MSGLRTTAERLRRAGGYPILSQERLFGTQRAAAQLAARRLDEGERTASARALRRQVARLSDAPLAAAVAQALAAERRSVDRALIAAYLAALPSRHPEFERLRAAAETAAERHDWRWRDLGRRCYLWQPEQDATGAWHLPSRSRDALAHHAAGRV